MHLIYIDGAAQPTIIQPADSQWRPRKAGYPWFVVDSITEKVVDRYTPVKVKRTKAITPVSRSWYASMHTTTKEVV